jgi:mannosylglucosylglycerate synthase
MRLALLHYTATPVTGGVESIMAAHARLLGGRGHDVRVIAGRGDAELVPEIDSRHPLVEAVANRLAAGDPAGAEFAALRERLTACLRPLLADRDLVVAHNVLTMPFNLPLAAALGDLGRPVLAWTHDLAWINPRYADYRHPGWPWSILHEAQPRTTYVAVSRTRGREIADTLGRRSGNVAVVPDGVDPESFLGVGAGIRELARRAGLEGADPMLLVPVRITPRKRLELAVEVAGLLRASHPRLRLVISGPLGPHSAGNLAYAAGLRDLRAGLGLGDAVKFLYELAANGEHPVDDRGIAELYRLADLVLLPSESEGFGLPVLESALARVPLVCADIPVLREVSAGDVWQYAAGSGAEVVADLVERALASRPSRLRRRAVTEYGWPAVLERMERVIDAAAGR